VFDVTQHNAADEKREPRTNDGAGLKHAERERDFIAREVVTYE